MAEEELATKLKAEIVSKTIIKPSSATPSHLRHFKLSLLDQLAPPSFFVPILLFYSSSDFHDFNFTQICQTLKSSLSEVLTLYYPFCGTIIINDTNNIPYVDCNDNGVVYLEARIPNSTLSDVLATRNEPGFRDQIKQFLPFDPYAANDEECDVVTMGVQVSEFACGSVAVGACISHRVCDGATMASFLGAWSEKARTTMETREECGGGGGAAVIMEGWERFPAREMKVNTTSGMTGERNIVTRRMVLSGKSVNELRERVCGEENKYTKVEVVTALIWKSFMEVGGVDGLPESEYGSMILHAVNLRPRMVPPLPDNATGNLWHVAVSPLVEIEKSKKIEVEELAQVVSKTIRKIDGDYVRKLEGKDNGELGIYEVLKSFKEVMILVAEKGIPCYSFSSWIRFGFYETQFGWGKPTWVCTIGVPIRNVVVFMPTQCGEGIEAWITLNHLHMAQLEKNPYLLQFASFDT